MPHQLTVDAEKADSDPVNPGLLDNRARARYRRCDDRGEAPSSAVRVGWLPRGKYAATLMFKAGDSEKILEQRKFATAGSIPADSAELRIRLPILELLRAPVTATHCAF